MEAQLLFNQQLQRRYQDIHLRDFVTKLITNLQPAARQQNCFVLNNISPTIIVTTDEKLLAAVINDLLTVVVSRNKNSSICISAKQFSALVLLHIDERQSKLKQSLLSDFDLLQPLAAKIGGCITVSGHEENSETLALSFLDYANVI